ncbi:hypothetical protein TgHK011_006521 [Trichoderma gracile]|nr:hypothetical protein TgHK011_006521 [Trichoderma gracile]
MAMAERQTRAVICRVNDKQRGERKSVGPAAPAVYCTDQHFITALQPISTSGSSFLAQRSSPLARNSAATEATSSLFRFPLDRPGSRSSYSNFRMGIALGIVPGLPCVSLPARTACGLPYLYESYRFPYVVPAPGAATPQPPAYSYFVPALGICRENKRERAARSPRTTAQLLQFSSE